MGTEEEERRLSNSEKSSLDVPLDALKRSKLSGGEEKRIQTETRTHTQTDNTQGTQMHINSRYTHTHIDRWKQTTQISMSMNILVS